MRAAWLESHDQFEGVGAHELNPRYDQVDDGDHDPHLEAAGFTVPLTQARSFFATQTPPRLDGIDVSHHQYDAGPINWATVAHIPISWGATKLTQSIRYLDPTSQRSRTSMFATGFRHVGLYHWLSSTTPVRQQAEWFLTNLGRLKVGEFAMLDAEEAGITAAGVLAWCEAVEAVTQCPCAVYTGAFVAGGSIWQSTEIRTSRFGARPMILAAYTTEAKALALPGVRAYPWSSWQFSSNGPVPGVTGRCDMNRVDVTGHYDVACGYVDHQPLIEAQLQAPTRPPPVHTTPIEDNDMTTRYVMDCTDPTHGSALVTLTVDDGGNPHYSVVGFNDAYVADAWRTAIGARPPLSPADYDAFAAGAR